MTTSLVAVGLLTTILTVAVTSSWSWQGLANAVAFGQVTRPITAPAAITTPSPAALAWQPPLGIPVPPFGILESAPAAPSPWTGPVANFYYVDASAPQATDTGNPYGYPAKPRASIPARLPEGAVVELRGVYNRSHAGGSLLRAEGTAEQPVFIRGLGPDHKTDVIQSLEVSGTHVILEHLRFRSAAPPVSGTGTLAFLSPLSHAALRHSEVSGNRDAGGLGIEAWTLGTTTSHVVIWNNTIHDNGNVDATFDQDRHGIHVGDHVSHVWVVDNEMWRNSGDGIQISARSAVNQPTTHHIYVGRNVSHHNKQNGFWTKQAVDVIFSQNTAYANRPSNSSMGAGLGFQYGPDYVWFLFNHVYDSDYGIASGSDSDLGTGTETFYIGNLIHDIHSGSGTFKAGTAWQNCGISLPGGVNRYIVNNTIINADSGVCTPDVDGTLEIHNNLIFGVRPDGQHIFLEFPRLAVAAKARGNVFGPNYRALTAGVQHRADAESIGTRGQNAVVRDPQLAAQSTLPYDLLPPSVAVDFGVDDPAGVYALFEKRYGIDIRRDFAGRPRPAGAWWDAGAFELQPDRTPAPRRR